MPFSRVLTACVWILLAASPASSVSANGRDVPINSATELRDWCRLQSEAALVGQGLAPFNWSATYWDDGDTLVAKGSWRTDAATFTVECRIARGARSQLASMSLQESR